MSYHLVLTTIPTLKKARRLAALLLEKKLAACVSISSPLESHYWWNQKKERGKEFFLFIKTKAVAFEKLEKVIRENHPYSVPEILAIPIQKGNPAYLAWIAKAVRV